MQLKGGNAASAGNSQPTRGRVAHVEHARERNLRSVLVITSSLLGLLSGTGLAAAQVVDEPPGSVFQDQSIREEQGYPPLVNHFGGFRAFTFPLLVVLPMVPCRKPSRSVTTRPCVTNTSERRTFSSKQRPANSDAGASSIRSFGVPRRRWRPGFATHHRNEGPEHQAGGKSGEPDRRGGPYEKPALIHSTPGIENAGSYEATRAKG
jgi:hypothetical protein